MRARQAKLHPNPLRVSATKVGGSRSRPAVEFAADLSSPEIRRLRQDGLRASKMLCCSHFLRHLCEGERTSFSRARPNLAPGMASWQWDRTRLSKMSRWRGRRADHADRRQGQDMRADSASGLPPAGWPACARSDEYRWRAGAPCAAHPSPACVRSGRDRGSGSDRRRR